MHFLRLALVIAALIAACGGSSSKDADPFDTFAACYNEHHNVESFSVQQTITICCIDHPIGGRPANVVCGSDAPACVSYVSMWVGSAGSGGSGTADASAADIQAACTDYINQRSM